MREVKSWSTFVFTYYMIRMMALVFLCLSRCYYFMYMTSASTPLTIVAIVKFNLFFFSFFRSWYLFSFFRSCMFCQQGHTFFLFSLTFIEHQEEIVHSYKRKIIRYWRTILLSQKEKNKRIFSLNSSNFYLRDFIH
jgi:hypothetical protein